MVHEKLLSDMEKRIMLCYINGEDFENVNLLNATLTRLKQLNFNRVKDDLDLIRAVRYTLGVVEKKTYST